MSLQVMTMDEVGEVSGCGPFGIPWVATSWFGIASGVYNAINWYSNMAFSYGDMRGNYFNYNGNSYPYYSGMEDDPRY